MDTLTIGCQRYETTQALFDGTVTLDGVHTTVHSEPIVADVFANMVRDGAYDVAELGWTFYLRTLEAGAPFVAVPVFPARAFRHSCVFVHAGSDIHRPEDLVGRTIGEFGVYGQDSGVWAKGILSDDHGFRPERNRWVIGGLDRPSEPFGFVPQPHPADVEVTTAPPGRALAEMLETGEIDALFTANVPQCYQDGSPHVRRLFPDYEPVERAYHRRTGIFPIMHTVVLPRDVAGERPDLVRAVYRGFLDAKEVAADRHRAARRIFQLDSMMPWANALVERNRDEFAADWWPYGVGANRAAIDTVLRYHHEQGITERRWTVDEVFTPELLDT